LNIPGFWFNLARLLARSGGVRVADDRGSRCRSGHLAAIAPEGGAPTGSFM